MTTKIKGQPTSEEIRQRLKDQNKSVILACSLGKDSLAAWCALEKAGIEVIPVYFWTIPNLPLINENIKTIENIFDTKIHLAPHPRFFRMLSRFVLQPPQRLSTIQYAGLQALDYEDMWIYLKEDLELPADTFVCDGVRACDSIPRRASLTKHGVYKPTTHKASVIADWQKHEVMDALVKRGIGLPPDYELFGRSFDGLDKRFIEPLQKARPADFALIKKWFPFVDADVCRWEHYNMHIEHTRTEYKDRAKNDNERYKLAVNSNYWLCFSFSNQKNKADFDKLFTGGDSDYLYGDTITIEPPTQTKKRIVSKHANIKLNYPASEQIDNARSHDGTLNDDALSLAESLLDAFDVVDNRQDSNSIFGSNIYSVVIFRDQQSQEQFAKSFGVNEVDVYVDGDKFLSKL